jgi:hypothetical protein
MKALSDHYKGQPPKLKGVFLDPNIRPPPEAVAEPPKRLV